MTCFCRALVSLIACLLSGCGLYFPQKTDVSNDPAYVGAYAKTKTYVAVKDLVVDKFPSGPGATDTHWCLVDPDNLFDLKRYPQQALGGSWNLSANAYMLKKGSEVRFRKGEKTKTTGSTYVFVFGTITDKDEKGVEVRLDFVSETDLFTFPDGRQTGIRVFAGPDPTCLQPKP